MLKRFHFGKKQGENDGNPPKKSDTGNMLAFFSLFFFTLILVEYVQFPNITAIFSIYPIWIWGLILGLPALVSWVCFNSKLGLVACCVWVICLAATNDHLPTISRFGKPISDITEHQLHRGCRLLTINCYSLKELDPSIFKKYNPRIIFLQGIQQQHQPHQFAYNMFGDDFKIRIHENCAIITDGGEVDGFMEIPGVEGLIIDWHSDELSATLRLVNINLEYVDSFKSIFTPSSWLYYSETRFVHRLQITNILESIKKAETSERGTLPLIIGGNFSIQSASPVFKDLDAKFTDAYKISATKYGATFPADLPVLRLERIMASSNVGFQFCNTIYIPGCTRKAVYADIYPKGD